MIHSGYWRFETEDSKVIKANNGLPVLVVGLVIGWSIAAGAVQGQEADNKVQFSPLPANVNLTVYNNGLGLVNEVRSLNLINGLNYIRCEGVAARVDPTSVSFRSLTAPNTVQVREQNYQYDLLSPSTILAKSIGKQVKFRRFLSSGGAEETSGTLLSAAPLIGPMTMGAVAAGPGSPPMHFSIHGDGGNQLPVYSGLVLKTTNAIVLNPVGQVELAELPDGLISKPSLLWKLESSREGKQNVQVAYQTGGMNWHCDYVAIVDKNDVKTDLDGWVTLDNQSGTGYKNVGLKLIAGEVHRVRPLPVMPMMAMAQGARFAGTAMPAPQFREASFSEYHMYSLQDKTDIKDNEMKQLSLFNASDVPTKKMYIFDLDLAQVISSDSDDDGNDLKGVQVTLELVNSAANNLGIPMPEGKVRVYKYDDEGALQFIGEDQINHTPKDEKVRLHIGNASDIVGKRTQTNVQAPTPRKQRLSYEIILHNHKNVDVAVTDVEHADGAWKIVSSSMPYTKKNARTFEFATIVPANDQATIDYTIELRD